MVAPPGSVDSAVDSVHPLVRKAAAWSWRLLVIGAAVLAVLWVVTQVQMIVVSLSIAVIVTALLLPPVDWLDRRGLPRGVGVAMVLLGGTAVLGGVLAFVVSQFISGLPALGGEVTRSIDSARDWLVDGPLGVSREQIDTFGNSAIEAVRDNQERLTSGALSTATTVTEIITGAFLVLFTVIFLLHGGRNIWAYVTRIVPSDTRQRVREAGKRGFSSLTGFVRATFFVAMVDAVGIGVGLAVMGVPLALPLASLVFLGAFIPVIGAVLTGLLAVVVALLSKGFLVAVLVLALVLAVQQIEGNVLQPLVMGRAVQIHPLAVLLAITAGAVLAGIVGALLAVPLLAFLNSATQRLLSDDATEEPGSHGVDEEPAEQGSVTAQPDGDDAGS
ncbi:AI-2E family transporter [Mycolicibacterium pyrenivorans]|uniref:AI-2E family transporter n=1 Tax=Mycolicibacterium pyrenivorans TaxID=187102 RepID=UPI0021F2A1F9|nr:AI-2E family transporter [Mycolicibacterium pyrenivorans]MCV7151078.1 AI-2E family transporter [Mycolicibacterium pyrenivorans]